MNLQNRILVKQKEAIAYYASYINDGARFVFRCVPINIISFYNR